MGSSHCSRANGADRHQQASSRNSTEKQCFKIQLQTWKRMAPAGDGIGAWKGGVREYTDLHGGRLQRHRKFMENNRKDEV